MGEIIYGDELSRELKAAMKVKIEGLVKDGKRVPCLAVILVGDNPASLSYVRGKEKACREVGIESRMIHLPQTASQQEVEEAVMSCSEDPGVDGILVQLPLPKGLNTQAVIHKVDPSKDVDGLHPLNLAALYDNERGFRPCTPLGVMELLKRMGCDPDGKHAVVLGRSSLVGTPVARLLLNANATVTMCHSHTHDLAAITRQADILVAAIGREKFVKADMVKEGAYVIDVGINRMADGHLCGDVDFDAVLPKAAAITPVPRGVGPMTIAMLLHNTLQAYQWRLADEYVGL